MKYSRKLLRTCRMPGASPLPTPMSRIEALKPAPVEPEPVAMVLPYGFMDRAAESFVTAKALGLKAEWEAWFQMISKCYLPDDPKYPTHGAVGVRVCSRWMKFEKFMEDMGATPGPSRKAVN